MPKDFNFTVRSKIPPVVTVDSVADAVYVYFQRGVKIARTKVINEWPLVAVDLDAAGDVIGIEALCPENFTLRSLANNAAVKVPKRLIDSATYTTTKPIMAVA